MTPEIAKILREPFQAEVVGKLPRVWCGACRQETKSARRQSACQQHQVQPCRICRNRITDAHLHLDYVGHAEVTDRLLKADPDWTWEPFSLDQRGLPALDEHGGMWIRLTVAGTTRIGYGDAEEKTGPDAVKVVIGNAIRLAAMRFGVGLDLWGAKFKADAEEHEHAESEPQPEQPKVTHEQWEQAKPKRDVPTPEQVAAKAKAAIMAAKTFDELWAHRDRVDVRFSNGLLTQDAYDGLTALAKGREVELRGQADVPAERMANQKQHARMAILWKAAELGGKDDRPARLAATAEIIRRDIESSKELTEAEAVAVIKHLVALVEKPKETT
jgi:hypothetical protein